MKKILLFVAASVIAATTSAQSVPGLNYNNSAGIITVDSVYGTACVVGIGVTCPLPVIPWGVMSATTTTSAGNIATANSFQNVLAQTPFRKGCLISNTSTATILVAAATAASAAPATSIPIPAGGKFNCGSPGGTVMNDALSVTSATAGATFVVWAQ